MTPSIDRDRAAPDLTTFRVNSPELPRCRGSAPNATADCASFAINGGGMSEAWNAGTVWLYGSTAAVMLDRPMDAQWRSGDPANGLTRRMRMAAQARGAWS